MTQTPIQVDDPWEIADNAKPREFEYYGQVKADVWFGYFPGGGAKPVPFDPAVHPMDKRTVMIEIQIIPIADQNVSFDVKQSLTDFSTDWTKIMLPSIKALGVDGLKHLNNRWVRMAQVDSKREKKDTNGNKTGEFYRCFKFLELYPDEAACIAAYTGGAPSHTEDVASTPADTTDKNRDAALKFARVIIENAARGQNDLGVIMATVTANIANFPMINQYFTGDSPEIVAMVADVMQSMTGAK